MWLRATPTAVVPIIVVVSGLLVSSSVVPTAHSLLDYEYVSEFGRHGIYHEGQMSHPQRIAEDHVRNLYVTDMGNKRVQVFGPDGAYLYQWGSSGTADGKFHEPAGIEIGRDLVYVVDRDLNRVQAFDLDGTYVTQWGERGTGHGQFFFPIAVALGTDGTVYVADSGNHRIQVFNATGQYLGHFGTTGSGAGQFVHLSDVTTDVQGNVYGTDRGNSKIEKFDPAGNHVATMRFEASNWKFAPSALEVAPDGSLFILNSADNRILHLEQDARSVLMTHEKIGKFQNMLTYGSDIALLESGHLVAVDSLGHKILKFETPFVDRNVQQPQTGADGEDSAEDESGGAATVGGTHGDEHAPSQQEDPAEPTQGGVGNESAGGGCSQPADSYHVIMGTQEDDVLEGTNSADLIFAFGGNDVVFGYDGDDCIFGGEGDDIVFGDGGSDEVFGDGGNDVLRGSSGNDILYGNYGDDLLDGGSGTDVCVSADTTGLDIIANCES